MLADVRGRVRACRDDTQLFRARKFESALRQLGRNTLAFNWGRDTGVVQRHQSRLTMVGEQRGETFDHSFKSLRRFVVADVNSIEIYRHVPPRCIATRVAKKLT